MKITLNIFIRIDHPSHSDDNISLKQHWSFFYLFIYLFIKKGEIVCFLM